MRYTVAFAALVALPALAIPVEERNLGVEPYYGEHQHEVYEHEPSRYGQHHGHHKPKPCGGDKPCGYYPKVQDKPNLPRPPKPHHHGHHGHHHAHHFDDHTLTDTLVCHKLNHLADKVDHITHFVKSLQCGYDDECWKKVKDALYELEFELDIFDVKIDLSNLEKCFTCSQESKIACCYRTYAESLIRLLKLIKHKSSYLEGELDKYILTAINSLRAADSALVYELGRRLHCEEYLKSIMEKQGAVDGSTKGSIQEAFSKFIFTPLITGEHFKNKGHENKHHQGDYGYEKKQYHKHPYHDAKLDRLEHKIEDELEYLKHSSHSS